VLLFDRPPPAGTGAGTARCLDYESYTEALDHLRRAVVLASRAKSWVQVTNVARIIFNVMRCLDIPTGDGTDGGDGADDGSGGGHQRFLRTLQLTASAALLCVAELAQLATASQRQAGSAAGIAAEKVDFVFVRDFFLESVRVLKPNRFVREHEEDTLGRFHAYVLDAGLTILHVCGKEHFVPIYTPLRALVRSSAPGRSALAKIVDRIDPAGALRATAAGNTAENSRFYATAVAQALAQSAAAAGGRGGRPDFTVAKQLCVAADTAAARQRLGDMAFADGALAEAAGHWTAAVSKLLGCPVGDVMELGGEAAPGAGYRLAASLCARLDGLDWWDRIGLVCVLGKIARETCVDNFDRATSLCRLVCAAAARAVLSCSGDPHWAEHDYATSSFHHRHVVATVPFCDDQHAGAIEIAVETLRWTLARMVTTGFFHEALPAITACELLGAEALRAVSVVSDMRIVRLEALAGLGLYTAAFKQMTRLLLGFDLPTDIDGLQLSSGMVRCCFPRALPAFADAVAVAAASEVTAAAAAFAFAFAAAAVATAATVACCIGCCCFSQVGS
jgi:hypothetical protein